MDIFDIFIVNVRVYNNFNVNFVCEGFVNWMIVKYVGKLKLFWFIKKCWRWENKQFELYVFITSDIFIKKQQLTKCLLKISLQAHHG